MNYIILTNCKDPYNARPFKRLTCDENMVYNNIEEAEQVASVLRKEEGEGSVRVVAI